MKKRILILSVLAVFFSCSDATDIVQAGELNDARLFTSVNNIQLFLNETYDRLGTENEILVSSLLTDEVAIGSGLVSNETQRFFLLTTNGFAANIWNSHYNTINYCNRLLRGAALYTPKASETAQYNSILAQARALRAFSHFQLLTYFSTDLSNDAAPGVMLVDFVPTADQDIPRSTNGEVFKLIESDLAYAQANLINPTGPTAYKFINSNFIRAFKARMYLYRKNYAQALINADDALTNSGLVLSTSTVSVANFPSTASTVVPNGAANGANTINVDPGTGFPVQRALFQIDQWASTSSPMYRKMWVDAAQGEILFAVDKPINKINFSSQYNTNGSYITGGPLYDMGRSLFNLYNADLGGGAQDYRRWCFVDRSSTISATPATASRTSEVIVIDKYPGKNGGHTANDLKVFRLSEIYFIKAECLIRSGNLTGAADLIRQVRQARSYTGGVVPLPVYANATAAIADVLLERRKELSFEGHRYIDLKRLGADAGVTGTDRFAQDAVNSSATNPVNINVTDYRFTLPIPQREINVNALTQNPGY
ncbi:RagB/SusD family nutrient uptake outer membrane protein [Flavobacterium sp. SOK18b]|uniref:RagB/SusD family nutrient uptake outer membrane protein n=1 Tax=Flavobacterium sp. SOK18b TaxID=797900 RepID=UPI0015FA51FF|nr:RagB/SusD family nutrient uptake outer membrane protein [Flavobacterium sp. SOK18b]MBB1194475.1 RagB/SusD family nutrient uptake outer membrane protein [Flavobacterium sp. SOK18b]